MVALLHDGICNVRISSCGPLSPRASLYSEIPLAGPLLPCCREQRAEEGPVTFAELCTGETSAWPHLEGIISRAVCQLLPHRGQAVILHREPPPE